MDLWESFYTSFSRVWREELVPPKGLIVNLFKEGDKEDPGNYRGITLLIVVGKAMVPYMKSSRF